MHVAMIGTRGVPARYGGFETAVEEIGWRLVERGHAVTVYCRNPEQSLTEYRGMRLVNLPAMRKKSLETLTHTGLSVAHATRRSNRPDAAVLFNAGNAPYIGFLRQARIPTAIHMDGLEWKRAKWAGGGAKYYKWAERTAAQSGCALIADAQGIADYLWSEYKKQSHLIAYGAPIMDPGDHRLAEIGLEPGEYHLVVARIEPENHVDLIVDGFSQARAEHPLVVVGSAPYGNDYVEKLRVAGLGADVRFIGSVWDQDLLNELYAHCLSYLHGHSVGGTNPSLLRALGCGAAVTAFDVNFNREVTAGYARFFGDASDVARAILADEDDPSSASLRGKLGKEHAEATYNWDDVTDKYEAMLLEISHRQR